MTVCTWQSENERERISVVIIETEGWTEWWGLKQRDIQIHTKNLNGIMSTWERGTERREADVQLWLAGMMKVWSWPIVRRRPSTIKDTYVHTHVFFSPIRHIAPLSLPLLLLPLLLPPSLSLSPIFNLPALILITQNAGEEPAREIKKENGEQREKGGRDGVKGKEWKEGREEGGGS